MFDFDSILRRGFRALTGDADINFKPKRELICLRSAVVGLALLLSIGAEGAVTRVYVDQSAAAGGDGTSWQAAFRELRYALLALGPNPDVLTEQEPVEIRIASGTYLPAATSSSEDRYKSFDFSGWYDMTVIGGFPVGGGGLATVNPRTNVTVLSGDLDGDGTPENNSYNVVTAKDNINLTFQGLVIEHGNTVYRKDDVAGVQKNQIVNLQRARTEAALRGFDLRGNLPSIGPGWIKIQAPNLSSVYNSRTPFGGWNEGDLPWLKKLSSASASPATWAFNQELFISSNRISDENGHEFPDPFNPLMKLDAIERYEGDFQIERPFSSGRRVFPFDIIPFEEDGMPGPRFEERNKDYLFAASLDDVNPFSHVAKPGFDRVSGLNRAYHDAIHRRGNGGGVRSFRCWRLLFQDCVFRFNSADAYGGAVFSKHSSVTYQNCVALRNRSGASGGAFCHLEDSFKFFECEFLKNEAVEGGGLYTLWEGDDYKSPSSDDLVGDAIALSQDTSRFARNVKRGLIAGAIRAAARDTVIQAVKNQFKNEAKEALFETFKDKYKSELTGKEIAKNLAKAVAYQGTKYFHQWLEEEGCGNNSDCIAYARFMNNVFKIVDLVLYWTDVFNLFNELKDFAEETNKSPDEVEEERRRAEEARLAAVLLERRQDFNSEARSIVRDCLFVENVSALGGVGIRSLHTNIRIDRTQFLNNRSTGASLLVGERRDDYEWGGAIHGSHYCDFLVSNCLFRGNRTHSGLASAIILRVNSSLFAEYCTLHNNKADEGFGSAFYGLTGVSSWFENSIFWGNRNSEFDVVGPADIQSITYDALPGEIKTRMANNGLDASDFGSSVAHLGDSFIESYPGSLGEGVQDKGGNTGVDPVLTADSRPQWNSPLLGYIPIRPVELREYSEKIEYIGNGFYGAVTNPGDVKDVLGVPRLHGSYADIGCFERAVVPARIYVGGAGVVGGQRGDSWSSGMADLATALDVIDHIVPAETEIWVREGVYQSPKDDGDPQDIAFRTHGHRNLRLYGGFEGDEMLADPSAFHLDVMEVCCRAELPVEGRNLIVFASVENQSEDWIRIFDSIGERVADFAVGSDVAWNFDKTRLSRSTPNLDQMRTIFGKLKSLLGLKQPDISLCLDGESDWIFGAEFDARLDLMEVERVSEIPDRGRSGIVVSRIIESGLLHFRVFDCVGRVVVDGLQTELDDPSDLVDSISLDLAGYWSSNPNTSEKADAIEEVMAFAQNEVGLKVRDSSSGTHQTTISGEHGASGDPSDNRKRLFSIDHDGRRRLKTLVVDGVTFKGAREGAFGLNPDSTQTLFRDCRFIENYNLSPTGRGGAIENQGDLTVFGSEFVGNYARKGGAIHSLGGRTTVLSSRFIDNVAEYRPNDAALIFEASAAGGAIYLDHSPATVQSSIFHGNQAIGIKAVGGAIAVSPDTQGTHADTFLTHCTIVGNQVVSGAGRVGAKPLGGGAGLFVNAFDYTQGATFIDGSIFWDNEVQGSEQVYPLPERQIDTQGKGYEILNSVVQGAATDALANVRSVNPSFDATSGDEFRLEDFSPLLNEISDSSPSFSGDAFDLLGRPTDDDFTVTLSPLDSLQEKRLFGAKRDLGAFELQSASASIGVPQSFYDAGLQLFGLSSVGFNNGPGERIRWQQFDGSGDPLLNSGDWIDLPDGADLDYVSSDSRSLLFRRNVSNYGDRYYRAVITRANGREIFSPPALFDAPILYVDHDAAGNNTGKSWTHAFTSLQDALAAARVSAGCREIWVAQGTYYPTGTFDRTISFEMVNGVGIYGGFEGGEALRVDSQRDASRTILSGDIGARNIKADNSYVVVRNAVAHGSRATLGPASILDGFVIEEGNANGQVFVADSQGGGMLNERSSPTLRNLIIQSNYANEGGGVANLDAEPTFINCTISNNTAEYGAGMFSRGGRINLDRCFIASNTAHARGGGLQSIDAIVALSFCEVRSNDGGGILHSRGQFDIRDSLVATNVGVHDAAGILVSDGGTGSVINCTVVYNRLDASGTPGLSRSGDDGQLFRVANSILWGNHFTSSRISEASANHQISGALNQTKCLVQNGGFGFDPLFVDDENGNYRLSVFSPAINSGDNAEVTDTLNSRDLDGGDSFRVQETTVDLGCYEFQTQTGGQLYFSSLPQSGAIESGKDLSMRLGNGQSAESFIIERIKDGVVATVIDDSFHVIRRNSNGLSLTLVSLDPSLDGAQYRFRDTSSESGFVSDVYELNVPSPIFVDGRVASSGNGRSWVSAKKTIRAALSVAVSGQQIWIAEGTYYPVDQASTDRTASLSLPQGVSLIGGFAGDEVSLSEREWERHPTRLSGDIGQVGVADDNSRVLLQVIGDVHGTPVSLETVIDGLIFSDGNQNLTRWDAALNLKGASPLVRNCRFENNRGYLGGAVTLDNSDAILFNCLFAGNLARNGGGGIYLRSGAGQIINCTVVGNQGGTISGGGGVLADASFTGQIVNTILWSNTDRRETNTGPSTVEQMQVRGTTMVSHSIVQGLDALAGSNNLGIDPLFLDLSLEDYRLNPFSPAVDAGDPAARLWDGLDAAGSSRVFNRGGGGIVDIGAYEAQSSARAPIGLVQSYDVGVITGSGRLDVKTLSGEANRYSWQVDRGDGAGFVALAGDGFHRITRTDTQLTLEILGAIQSMRGYRYRYVVANTTPSFVGSPVRLEVVPPVRVDSTIVSKLTAAQLDTRIEDGSSWLNAYVSLTDALNQVSRGGEIWVAEGIYYPSDPTAGRRDQAFAMRPDVGIYGGFKGFGANAESLRSERDPVLNRSILSGDIGVLNDPTDNSFNVIRNQGLTEALDRDSVLDGFVIVGAYREASANFDLSDGGAIHNQSNHPTIRNCVIEGNLGQRGGGIANYDSAPLISRVEVRNNRAATGAGLYNHYSSPRIENCLIAGNTASGDANRFGGGVFNDVSSAPTFLFCTVSANQSPFGGAGIGNDSSASPIIANSILWGNLSGDIAGTSLFGGTPTVSFSTVQASPSPAGTGNQNFNPLFQAWRTQDYSLSPFSPALDSASTSVAMEDTAFLDLSGAPRVSGAQSDLGCYELDLSSGRKSPIMLTSAPEQGFSMGSTEFPVIGHPAALVQWEMDLTNDNVVSFVPLIESPNRQLRTTASASTLEVIEPTAAASFRFKAVQNGEVFVSEAFSVAVMDPILVKSDASGVEDGKTWGTAFRTLTSALAQASLGQEIWVAAGVYFPTSGRDASVAFEMKDRVAIYGGFDGTESNRDSRDWLSNVTVLSGNIGELSVESDNSLHVLSNRDLSRRAVLDGFVIEGAFGGAAMLNRNASPTVRHCVFRDNQSLVTGAGIVNVLGAPLIEASSFYRNRGLRGGALESLGAGSFPEVVNSLFYENEAVSDGGAIFNEDGGRFVNVTVAFNRTGELVGGMDNAKANAVTVSNSILWGNQPSFSNRSQVLSGQIRKGTILQSIVQGMAIPGEDGNSGLDPLFVNPAFGMFQLSGFSPGIDAGNSSYLDDRFSKDLMNRDRRFAGTTVDLGAYEFQGARVGDIGLFQAFTDTTLLGGGTLRVRVPSGQGAKVEWLQDVGAGFVPVVMDSVHSVLIDDESSALRILNPAIDLNGARYAFQIVVPSAGTFQSGSATLKVFAPLLVDASVTPVASGRDTNGVYQSLQQALAEVSEGGAIWVAAGTYTPTGIDSGDRSASFGLVPGVSVLGGFESGQLPAQWSAASRDPDQFVTRLSGEIGDPNLRTDNSFRVIDNDGRTRDLGERTILDGFVVEGGYGTNGVGMRNVDASPVIRDCVFRDHYASASGAAVENQGTSAPLIAACRFYDNESGSTGGAISNFGSGNPLVVNSVFQGNRSGGAGGAIYSEALAAVINGTFTLNHSGGLGGAVFGLTPDSVEVVNSILWGNTATEEVSVEQGQVFGAAVTDSIVHGLEKLAGNRNIALDPLFIDPSQYDLRLSVYSPAVDQGAAGKDPSGQTTDAWKQPRVFGSQVDLGAFEVPSVSPGALGIIEGYSVVELAEGETVLRLRVAAGSVGSIVWQVDRGAGFEDLVSDAVHELLVSGEVVQLKIVSPSFSMNGFRYRYRVNGTAPEFVSFPVTLKVAPAIRVSQATGSDDNDGLSWGQAVKSIQKALSLVTTNGEIWVAAGTYYPTDGGNTGRGTSFQFGQRVSVYGGFRGDEGTRAARDWRLNPTILSGDIGNIGDDSDNSYHVLEHRSSEGLNGTHLDGVIVQDGHASGSGYQQDYGGGIFVHSGTLTLRNTMIRENKASWRGGAVAIEQGKLQLEGALIYNNSAVSSAGAIVLLSGDVTLTNTTVTENTSGSRTAGIDVFPGGRLTVSNSILHNNRTSGAASDLETQQLSGNASVFNSIVEGLNRYRSANSFAIDPLFADPENDDFSLSAFSGAIGRGSNASLPTGYTTDLDGVARVLPANDRTVDMGAYEYSGAAAGGLEVVQFPSFDSLIGGGELKVVVTPSFRNRIIWQIDRGDGTFVDLVADSVHSVVFGADSSTLKVSFPDAHLAGARYRFRVSGTSPEYVSESASLRLLPVLKVDADAAAGGDGLSWTTAFRTIQEAFAALPTVGLREIWVAEGTYYPSLTNARGDSFELQNNLRIYGGFQGGDDSEALSDRDWKSYPTILSGNIGSSSSSSDNSKRIIHNRGSSQINASAVLDGFVIEAGNGDNGAGIYNYAASPTIRNCHFRNNVVTSLGGAMYCIDSSPIVSDCIFENNEAQMGGSVRLSSGAAEFRRCQFLGGRASLGGGLSVGNSPALFENCLFAGNHATGSGGNYGGAIAVSYVDATGKTRFLNCTVVDNTSAGGAAGIELSPTPFGPVEVHNSILWNNLARGVANFDSQLKGNGITIRHSMVNGISDFGGNIASPPDFVAPSQKDYRLTACSFGINQGNNAAIPLPSLDLAGNARLFDGQAESDVVDMGAYELAGEVPANRLVLNASPVSRGVQEGGNASFSVTAVGDAVTYQWQSDDKGNGVFANLSDTAPYSGVTSSSLSVTAIPATLNGTQYRCVVTAASGCQEISESASLGVRFSTLFVDVDVTGNGDGSSWENAFTDLQASIATAAALNTEVEIWVAEGTYYPAGINSGNRDASFMMYPNVSLLGGFSGAEEAASERDWERNLSILSGDIGVANDNTDNSKHVVFASGPDIQKTLGPSAILDGFIVEKGYGPGGSGLHVDGASPTIRNVVFRGHVSTAKGGAIYIDREVEGFTQDSSPSFESCRFENNTAQSGGGAVFGIHMGNQRFQECVFENNRTLSGRGGAASFETKPFVAASNLQFLSCSFVGNQSTGPGGAMAVDQEDGELNLRNCFFGGNRATSGAGGALSLGLEGGSTNESFVVGCTFLANRARWGGGAISNRVRNFEMHNSIIWNNRDTSGTGGNRALDVSSDQSIIRQQVTIKSSSLENYAGIKGLIEERLDPYTPTSFTKFVAIGNLSVDPLFVQMGDPDVAPSVSVSPEINWCSPVIDRGFTTELVGSDRDVTGNSRRFRRGAPDIGAYELQEERIPSISIVSHPEDAYSSPSGTAVFSVIARGSFDSYLWQQDLGDGAGWMGLQESATYQNVGTDTLTIVGPALLLDQSSYRCVVSSAVGCAPISSNGADLFVDSTPPSITGMPDTIYLYPASGDRSAEATWTEPVASDNYAVATLVHDGPQDRVFAEGTTTVTYTATDLAGNVRTAKFDVIVTPLIAAILPSPKPGGAVDQNSEFVSIEFDQSIAGSSLGDQSVFVYGSQSGRSSIGNGGLDSLEANGAAIRIQDLESFYPGESVQVTFTDKVMSTRTHAMEPYIWSFQMANRSSDGGFDLDLESIMPNADLIPKLGDLDEDGDLDLWLADPMGGSRWMRNDGSGVFADAGQSMGSAKVNSVELLDLDGDGDLDGVVLTEVGLAIECWMNDGNGVFTSRVNSVGTGDVRDLAVGDFNGDGVLDLFAAHHDAPSEYWKNDGTGFFSVEWSTPGSERASGIEAGDLDLDGDLDVILTRVDSLGASQSDQVYLNRMRGSFLGPFDLTVSEADITQLGATIDSIDSPRDGDFSVSRMIDGNTGTDTWYEDFNNEPQNALLNISFDSAYYLSRYAITSTIHSWAPASWRVWNFQDGVRTDIDERSGQSFRNMATIANGVPPLNPVDHVWLSLFGQSFARYLMISEIQFYGRALPVAELTSRRILLADIDNDSDLDLISGNPSSTETRVYLNDGSVGRDRVPQFSHGRVLFKGGLEAGSYFGDFDGNQLRDVFALTTAPSGGLESHVLRNEGGGTFSVHQTIVGGKRLALGDIEGDGDLDAVMVVEPGLDGGASAAELIASRYSQLPIASGTKIEILEDHSFSFTRTFFEDRVSDDGAFSGIKIVALPANGSLKLGSATIAVGQLLDPDQLSEFVYVPQRGFSGKNWFEWQARDRSDQLFSASGRVQIKVIPVNDRPIMSSISDRTFDIAKANPWVRYFDPSPGDSDQEWFMELSHDNPQLIRSVTRDVSANDRINRRGKIRFDFVEGQIGSALVTVVVTDDGGTAHGGIDRFVTTFTVTVRDTVNPAIANMPADISVVVGAGSRLVPVTWDPPTLNVNSGLTNLSSSHSSGDLFPIGATPVVYTASDGSGNEETATFTVTVLDQESPMVVNPISSFDVPLPIGDVTAQVYWAPPVFADNDRIKLQGSTHVPGDVFPAGDTAVQYWAEDPSGNRLSSEFVVSVVDRELPVLSGVPSDRTQETDPGLASATVTWLPPVASDNSGSVQLSASHSPGEMFAVGETVVTYAAVDGAGNRTDGDFTVRVVDREAPSYATFPADIDVATDAGLATATVTWVAPVASDNVGVVTSTATQQPGAKFPLGRNVVVYSARDAADNVVTRSLVISVLDQERPSISGLPADISIPVSAGAEGMSIDWVEPTASDNVAVASFTSSHQPGALFPIGLTTVTYTAKDSAGNELSRSFKVQVTDDEAPSFVGSLETVEVPTDPGLASARVTWDAPLVHDNGERVALSYSRAPGSIFPLGTTTVNVTATDISGNQASDSFDVVVVDEESPVFESVPADITLILASGEESAVVTWENPVVSDNVAVTSSVASPSSGSSFEIGVHTITLTASDLAGNETVESFVVFVLPTGNIINVSPSESGAMIAADSSLSLTGDLDLASHTVDEDSIRVHLSQSGGFRSGDRGFESVTGVRERVEIQPKKAFKAGERVSITSTRSLKNRLGGPMNARTWQFLAGVDSSEGALIPPLGPVADADGEMVALGDFDGDGDLDCFLASTAADRVLLNDGLGSFSDTGQRLGQSPSQPKDVDLGDLDGDGDVDVVVTGLGSHGTQVYLNDGQGGFQDQGQVFLDGVFYAAELGDLDSDGDLDLFLANYDGADRVYLNDGFATFNDGGQMLGNIDRGGVTGWSVSVDASIGDVDRDGDLDIVVSEFDGYWYQLTNDGTGNFSAMRLPTMPFGQQRKIELADLDGDGDLDAMSLYGTGYAVWGRDSEGALSVVDQFDPEVMDAMALGDIDGDGDLDMVISGQDRGYKFWMNDGTGAFEVGPRVDGSLNLGLALGDIDGDGDLDLIGNQSWCYNQHAVLADKAYTISEEENISLEAADFAALREDGDGPSFAGIQISKVPTKGTLVTGGVTLKDGDVLVPSTMQSLEYVPNEGSVGEDSFEWDATDGLAYSENPATISITITPSSIPAIVGRNIFYNNSSFDQNDSAINEHDDSAVATNKSALRNGQMGTLSHVSNYSKGLNGVMIDVENIPDTISLADFSFKVGNDNDPANWVAGPTPAQLLFRAGAGTGGSDRITLVWIDNNRDGVDDVNEAPHGKWMQITVLANASTGLAADDVFYFGNAIGETGNAPGSARVTTADVLLVRNNPKSFLSPALITDPHDIDRDARVNGVDVLLARNHMTSFLNELQLIDLTGLIAADSAIGGGVEVDASLPAQAEIAKALDALTARESISEVRPPSLSLDPSGQIKITFPGVSGGSYSVFYKDGMDRPDWRELSADVVEVSPGWFVVMDSTESPSRFYQFKLNHSEHE